MVGDEHFLDYLISLISQQLNKRWFNDRSFKVRLIICIVLPEASESDLKILDSDHNLIFPALWLSICCLDIQTMLRIPAGSPVSHIKLSLNSACASWIVDLNDPVTSNYPRLDFAHSTIVAWAPASAKRSVAPVGGRVLSESICAWLSLRRGHPDIVKRR